MPRHDDLGVSAYTESREHGDAQNAFGSVPNGGRSRGTTPLSTLPLRTRTARGRPRTSDVESVALHGASLGIPDPVARALGRKPRRRVIAFILGRRS